MEPGAGQVIDGRYVLEAKLGEGGMAEVWRARHRHLDTVHGIKILHLASRTLRRRLLQEGRLQGALRHPNVVAITDVVAIDGSPALVMELVEGPSLARLLDTRRLTLDEADQIARGILQGVAAAHRAGLVHRDLKPGNVLLSLTSDRLVPKVADFGLAKILTTGGHGETRSGIAMGTPSYMSPEQTRDAKNVDARSDVFSLGVLLYELVTGTVPFVAADTLELYQRIGSGAHRPAEELQPDLPARMSRAIEAALQPDPAARLPDAGALLAVWTEQPTAEDLSGWDADLLHTARSLDSNPPPFEVPAHTVDVDLLFNNETTAFDALESIAPTAPIAQPRRLLPPRFGLLVMTIVVGIGIGTAAWFMPAAGPGTFSAEGVPHVLDAAAEQALDRAWNALLRADLRVAEREAEHLVAARPDLLEARLVLFAVRRTIGPHHGAFDLVHDRTVDPSNHSGPLRDLLLALRSVEPDIAVSRWSAAHPDDLLGAALRLLVAKPEESPAISFELVEDHPDLALAWLLRAKVLGAFTYGERALNALDRADALTPGSGWLAYVRGELVARHAKLPAARDAYITALQRDPGLMQARTGLATTLLYLGEDAEALRHAAMLRDETVPVVERLAFAEAFSTALAGVGKLTEAREVLRWGRSLGDSAGHPTEVARLALVEFTIEDLAGPYPATEASLRHLRELAALPDLPPKLLSHLQTGLLAIEAERALALGERERAEALASRLARVDPSAAARFYIARRIADGDAQAHPANEACLGRQLRVRVLLAHGHEDVARAALEQLAEREGCHPTGFYRLVGAEASTTAAELAQARGEVAVARRHTAKARELWPRPDPDHPVAARITALESALASAEPSGAVR